MGNKEVKDGDGEDNKEDVMDVLVILPPLVARRVERLKFLDTERERG